MKPVLWFASIIGAFSLVFYVTQSVFLALIATGGWFYVLGRLVHGPSAWKRRKRLPRDRFPVVESDYAASSLDYSASDVARSFARAREDSFAQVREDK
jgi:hypothetical protein